MGEDICISTHRLQRALCYRGGKTVPPRTTLGQDDERTHALSTRTKTTWCGWAGKLKAAGTNMCALRDALGRE